MNAPVHMYAPSIGPSFFQLRFAFLNGSNLHLIVKCIGLDWIRLDYKLDLNQANSTSISFVDDGNLVVFLVLEDEKVVVNVV
jgi:hypothetical protein